MIVFVPYFILFFGMVSISWPWRLLSISWTAFLWRWGKWRIITSSSTILRLLLTFGSFSSADGVIVLHECVCLELFAVLHKMNQWKLVLILSLFINLNISLGEIEEEEVLGLIEWMKHTEMSYLCLFLFRSDVRYFKWSLNRKNISSVRFIKYFEFFTKIFHYEKYIRNTIKSA